MAGEPNLPWELDSDDAGWFLHDGTGGADPTTARRLLRFDRTEVGDLLAVQTELNALESRITALTEALAGIIQKCDVCEKWAVWEGYYHEQWNYYCEDHTDHDRRLRPFPPTYAADEIAARAALASSPQGKAT